MSALGISVWIVTGLLGFMYLMAGFMKASNPAKAKEMGETMAVQSDGKLRIIGVLEILGAIGIVGAALADYDMVAGAAAVGLFGIQAFAIPEHFKHQETEKIGMNFALLLMAAFVALARFDVF